MNTPINDGGPAFPLNSFVIDDLEGQGRDEQLTVEPILHYPGMSMRDWYAGLAMQGQLSNSPAMERLADQVGAEFPTVLADRSYRIADAMVYKRASK